MLLLGLALASPGLGQPEKLSDRLASKDPAVARAAVAEVLGDADRAEPLLLMHAASRHLEFGSKDEAVQWFYAGQLRARYSPLLAGEQSQLVTISTMTLGEAINAHGMRDIVRMIELIARAMQWDEKTYDAWAKANQLDPNSAELLKRRADARDGLVAFATDLKVNRQKYEKAARDYKSPEQLQREAEESVQRDYTTAPLERVVGGKTLRIPANYVTAHGLTARPRESTRELTLVVFLPKFVGYTLENWRDLSGNKNVMWVRLKPDAGPKPEELIEAFIATEPPTAQVFGTTAYQFDARATKARLPLPAASTHHVIAGKSAQGAPAYVICQAPEPGVSIKPAPRCELFTVDGTTGLRVHAQFFQDHAREWRRIEAHLGEFLKTWAVAQ
ncbi:MAG TPA: hypothetical protein VIE36_05810 [Methylomirabilota bacterium]